jgi:hypothetical protein
MSKKLVSPADGSYGIIRLPRYAFVTDVWLEVITAAVAGIPTLTIGFIGNKDTADDDFFMGTTHAAPDVLGIKRSSLDPTTVDNKYFNAGSGSITFTWAAGGATTVGVYRVFCAYTVIT